MIERLIDTDALVAITLATFAAPLVFLAVVVVAAVRRGRSGAIGSGLVALVAFTGGIALGTFLLLGADPVLALPIAVAVGGVALDRWRRRRRIEAGWFLLGAGLPVALAWTYAAATAQPTTGERAGAVELAWLAGGITLTLVGLALLLRGDPPPARPAIDASPGQPGSRSFGSIAEAIRQPTFIGPFGQPELAMLLSFVAVSLVLPFLIPADWPAIVRDALLAAALAVIGAEVYVRAMPTSSRRAFEAFSWLGEWELARARAWTGRGVPTSRAAAERWLAERPERLEEVPLRIEILLFADMLDEARRLLERLPPPTDPAEAFERSAVRDLVEWRAGGDGDLGVMREAAAAIEPADGDDRLRADVTVAVAEVRRLMADGRVTAAEAIQPLLRVRERLGRRADGQVGRALRPRLIPLIFVLSFVVTLGAEVLAGMSGPSPF